MRFPRLFSLLAAALLAVASVRAQTVVVTPNTTTLNAQGGTLTFTATFSYTVAPSVLALKLTLPTNWTYVSGANEPTFLKPDAGQQGELGWAYLTAPDTPPSFTFTASYPASVTSLTSVAATSIGRTGTGADPVQASAAPVYIESASTAVTWNGTTGNWNDSTKWTPGVVPNNNQNEAFSVTMASGTATLSSSYSINNLTFTGGTISGFNGSLALNGLSSTWLAGAFADLGNLAISPGAHLTADGLDTHFFDNTTISNSGEFVWNGSGSLIGPNSNFVINQGGTLTDNSAVVETYTAIDLRPALANNVAGTQANLAAQFSPGGAFINGGTYLKTAASETRVFASSFVNNGTLQINAGLLTVDAPFTQSSVGKLVLANDTAVTFTSSPTFSGGSITGSGTINSASPVLVDGFVSPGNILGELTVNGDLSLRALSNLQIDINGASRGVTYDTLTVFGTAALSGNLTLNILDNALATLNAAHTLTILSATSVTGTFVNLPNGARIYTTDNIASFLINYTPTSVTLTGFTAVPEPSTWALMIAGAGALGVRALRRRRVS